MIPARALNELARVLADVDDPVEVVLAAAEPGLFHLEGVDLVSRLIDGQFPNYQQVLPQSHNTRAVLDREAPSGGPAGADRPESANIVKLQIGGNGDPASPSARMPRSATTSGPSRRPSRATGRRSRSTPATWPTC